MSSPTRRRRPSKIVEGPDGSFVDEEVLKRLSKVSLDFQNSTTSVGNWKNQNNGELLIVSGTWNLNGKKIKATDSLKDWLGYEYFVNDSKELKPVSTETPLSPQPTSTSKKWFRRIPDIVAVNFQEMVSLNLSNILSVTESKAHERCRLLSCAVLEHLNGFYTLESTDEDLNNDSDDYLYALVSSKFIVGVGIAVFIREPLLEYLYAIETARTPCGTLNMVGNKGAAAVRFQLQHFGSLCFISSHLAAHRANVKERNRNYHHILSTLKFSLSKLYKTNQESEVLQHDIVVWAGDLNYRPNIAITVEEALELAEMFYPNASSGDTKTLQNRGFRRLRQLASMDQLNEQRFQKNVFSEWSEGPLNFPPTFKIILGASEFDHGQSGKKRAPSWCDRVLWYAKSTTTKVCPLYYGRSIICGSDHLPVSCVLKVSTKELIPSTRTIQNANGVKKRRSNSVDALRQSNNKVLRRTSSSEVIRQCSIRSAGRKAKYLNKRTSKNTRTSNTTSTLSISDLNSNSSVHFQNSKNSSPSLSILPVWCSINAIEEGKRSIAILHFTREKLLKSQSFGWIKDIKINNTTLHNASLYIQEACTDVICELESILKHSQEIELNKPNSSLFIQNNTTQRRNNNVNGALSCYLTKSEIEDHIASCSSAYMSMANKDTEYCSSLILTIAATSVSNLLLGLTPNGDGLLQQENGSQLVKKIYNIFRTLCDMSRSIPIVCAYETMCADISGSLNNKIKNKNVRKMGVRSYQQNSNNKILMSDKTPSLQPWQPTSLYGGFLVAIESKVDVIVDFVFQPKNEIYINEKNQEFQNKTSCAEHCGGMILPSHAFGIAALLSSTWHAEFNECMRVIGTKNMVSDILSRHVLNEIKSLLYRIQIESVQLFITFRIWNHEMNDATENEEGNQITFDPGETSNQMKIARLHKALHKTVNMWLTGTWRPLLLNSITADISLASQGLIPALELLRAFTSRSIEIARQFQTILNVISNSPFVTQKQNIKRRRRANDKVRDYCYSVLQCLQEFNNKLEIGLRRHHVQFIRSKLFSDRIKYVERFQQEQMAKIKRMKNSKNSLLFSPHSNMQTEKRNDSKTLLENIRLQISSLMSRLEAQRSLIETVKQINAHGFPSTLRSEKVCADAIAAMDVLHLVNTHAEQLKNNIEKDANFHSELKTCTKWGDLLSAQAIEYKTLLRVFLLRHSK